ncbi:protein ENHANCED DOWNY MILDEW 2-like [Miscanthus floridulus]|uniref:protein ENHANCED DOWNY MILDEW 2-like n=1 Tax=Miscanthus floridulus TaxID=154761 RepID=UPI0034575F88
MEWSHKLRMSMDTTLRMVRGNPLLHGFADKSLRVYKEVVAWKIRLDSEQPNIYVLSIQHKWIKLLKPRKCYGEFVRSILITVQMLHFVRRGWQRSSLNHLDEVFGKYNPKPVADDLMKHHNLIKLFVEKDQTLMKSKILQRLIENGFERTKKALGLEAQFIVSMRRLTQGEISCEGPCKRSFHPTEKDGRESKCETLGYTSAEVKRIGTYLCANCKNRQHQCFRCGELEPSHGPNAKVFQCNQASCGYFYHPKCIAQLLDPNATDGACELERRIMAGMSFPCPIHWCFKCGRMENKTQRALQLAVCRRCPRAYHRECLPRELSFGAKDKDGNPRAWKLSKTIFIYCLDHEIDKDTGAASRNHIKFPATPECTKTKELSNSEGRMTGKRRKNTDQSTKPTELSNWLCGAESEQADNVGAKSTSPQIVVEPHCAAKLLKGDPQLEQSIIGVAASQNGAETMKGHEKQFGISSCVPSTETEKW